MIYPDVYFTEDYQNLFATTAFGGEPIYYQFGGIDYRFYLRRIEGTHYNDITSVYGYGGPIALDATADWQGFFKAFNLYCQQNSVVSEFARLHPFEENQTHLLNIVQSGEVYYVDLTKPFEFDKGCKSAIKKADKNDLYVSLDADYRQWWVDMYRATMTKDNANESYFFNEEFWHKLFALDSSALFGVHNGELMFAGCIVLIHGDYAHYFLSGEL